MSDATRKVRIKIGARNPEDALRILEAVKKELVGRDKTADLTVDIQAPEAATSRNEQEETHVNAALGSKLEQLAEAVATPSPKAENPALKEILEQRKRREKAFGWLRSTCKAVFGILTFTKAK